jgi:Family of unknown function (DUF6062)
MSDPAPFRTESGATASDLTKALKSGHCPICSLLRDDEFQELCRWVGDNTANKNNRRRLDDAGGFCNYHFWRLRKVHSPLSGSLVNDFVAAKFLSSLRNPAGGDGLGHAQWLRTAAEQCPLCVHLDGREATHLRALADWFGEPSAWQEYENSRGLCLPHLARLQPLIDRPTLRSQLISTQVVQVERLQKEMREFRRRFETGRRWKISHDEWKAWERVIEKLVGREGAPFPR